MLRLLTLLSMQQTAEERFELLFLLQHEEKEDEKRWYRYKAIVAFVNTQGGKLIVGIDDKTHQIEGVENDTLLQMMDGIANAVSDSCVLQIIPDIEPQTVDGKTVIVVSVEAGKNRPYYLKSKEKDNGTYIRVADTSRQAFPEKIKELEMEGANLLLCDKQLSAVKIAEQLDLGSRSIEKNIKKLKEYGILIRHGSPKSGYWEIVEKEL